MFDEQENIDLGETAAKRQTFLTGGRALMHDIVNEHPDMSDQEVIKIFLGVCAPHQDEMNLYYADNALRAIRPRHSGKPKPSHEDIASKALGRLVDLLPKIMKMSGAECRQGSAWLARAADGVADNEIVGEKKTEEQVLALLETH